MGSLFWEDPTWHEATKPVCHHYGAHVLQLLKPMSPRAWLHKKRSHHSEKPERYSKEDPHSYN